MRASIGILAIASLVAAPVAHAASDPGLAPPLAQVAAPRMGAGVQAAITVPLGARAERSVPRLSLRAGPSMTRTSGVAQTIRTRVAPLAEFSLRPGHSSTVSLAGTPVAQRFTLVGAREEQAERERSSQRNVSTLGAIGIGVGVLAVAAGIGLLVLIDEIEDNSD